MQKSPGLQQALAFAFGLQGSQAGFNFAGVPSRRKHEPVSAAEVNNGCMDNKASRKTNTAGD